MYFSIIIPVYNRPDEINELLESLLLTAYIGAYEVVIVEDGSTITCEEVVLKYSSTLNISYYFKANSGPGDSRNFGMQKAKGDYLRTPIIWLKHPNPKSHHNFRTHLSY